MMEQQTGGFQASRDFGFALEGRFPGLNIQAIESDGVALVVTITEPRALSLYKLSKVLLGAARGGVKTAVISVPSKGLTAALPLMNLWLAVDESAELKTLLRVERLAKAA